MSNYKNKSRLEKRLSFSLRELRSEIDQLDLDINYVSLKINKIIY